MDPVLRVIQYLFETHSKIMTNETIESFLKNGINFPQFVAMAFNIDIDKIPVFENSYEIYDDIDFSEEEDFDEFNSFNNYSALMYIIEHNMNIRKISSMFKEKLTYKSIISLTLINQCFHINVQEILFIIYHITGSYKTEKDIFDFKFLLKLINILKGEKIPAKKKLYKFDDIIQSFKKEKIPLVIDESCFKKPYHFLLLIQIEIIFKKFDKKIHPIIDEWSKISNDEDDDDDDIIDDLIFDDIYGDYISSRKLYLCESFEFGIDNFDQFKPEISEQEKIMDKGILDTINAIGKYENKFHTFEEAVEKDNLPYFLISLFKDDQSAKDYLNCNTHDFWRMKLKDKVKYVIDLLKEKESKFNTLFFDFEQPNHVEASSILLYTNILDSFFLKKSKDELYDRCYTLLYGKYKRKDSNYHRRYKMKEFNYHEYEDAQGILYDWKTYIILINFINNRNAKIIHKLLNKKIVLKYNRKIPVVISKEYLNVCPKEYIPNAIYYQLQFIFNELDKSDFLHRIVEYFLIAIRKFSQLRVPPLSKLAASIKTKNISLIIQNERYKQNLNIKNFDINSNNNENLNDKPNHISKHKHHKKSYATTVNSDTKDIINISQIEKKIIYENGLLFEEDFGKFSSIFYISSINIKYDYSFIPLFAKTDPNEERTNYSFFKIFKYDENLNKWSMIDEKINNTIKQLSKMNYKRIPLVLFIESNQENVLVLLKTINNRLKEEIRFDNDNICVYGYLDNDIYKLLYDNSSTFNDKDQKTKPLFIFLNVPKNKENLPNIQAIVFQIYFFLSIIGDINIVILDRYKCIEQTKVINNIFKLKEYYKKIEYEINDKDFQALIPTILKNQMNFFILNSFTLNYIQESDKIKNKSIFNEIKCEIDIDKKSSYKDFINKFLKSAVKSNNGPEDISKKFSLIKYFPMDNYYFNWILNDFNDEYLSRSLNSKIVNSFGNDKNMIIDPSFLSELQSNLFDSFPRIDSSYSNKCNEILKEMKDQISLDINSVLKKELKKRSKNHLKNLSQVLKSRIYWSSEKLDNIQREHTIFLKDEFFSIIQELYLVELIPLIYEENEKILENRIRKDSKKIEKILDQVEKQQKVCSSTIEVDAEKGTNYTIREIENEREVKARIESTGKLEDLIEQDF